MHTYQVEVEAHPTFQDGAFLEDQLYAYNVKQTGYDDGTYLTLLGEKPHGGTARQASMAGRGVAVVTFGPSGSTQTCADRVMVRDSYTQRNRKPAPVAVTKWSSARSVFRHLASTRSWAMT